MYTQQPAQPTQEIDTHANPMLGMIEVYFYILVDFPSKQNKVCIKFGFPALRRTGKFKPLLLYTRGLAERLLGLNRAIKVR